MKKTLISLGLVGAVTAVATAPMIASAHDGDTYDGGAYVVDINGHLVTDGFGNCVKTGSWKKEDAIMECDPDLVPVAEPEPEPAPPPPPPAPKPVFQTVTLGAGALFDLNKADLKPEGKAQLDDLAAKLSALSSIEHISIVGHTDSTGSDSYNMDLSIRRANAVKAYLLDRGVDPRNMSSSGMGETQPVATNATREGRAQNRRVEITLRGSKQVSQ